MTLPRSALPLFVCVVALLGGRLPDARAEDTLKKARYEFIRTRNTCALSAALTGPGVKADDRAPTDGLLSVLACDQALSPASTGGTGYDALPALVVALKGMNLDMAAETAASVGDRTAGGIGRWAEALVLARRGRDGQAIALLLAPLPGDHVDVERVLFPLALFGCALAEDDRLLLAAMAREAIFEACRRGLVDRVIPIARRAAALDPIIGPDCVCLAVRALRRSGRLRDAGALLAGPESAEYPEVRACLQLERAVRHWRAGDSDQARTLAAPLANGSLNGRDAFLVEGLQRSLRPLTPVPFSGTTLQAPDADRSIRTLSRFATLLGSESSPGAVEAAALGRGKDPTDAAFAPEYLESLGYRVVLTAGSARTAEAALREGLPFLLYRVRLRGDAFVEEPVVVRGRDASTGLWVVDPCDLRESDALPRDVHLKARLLVAVPASRKQDPASWASTREKTLGRALTRAVDLADRGDEAGAVGHLESLTANLGDEAAYLLYLGFIHHLRVRTAEDSTHLLTAEDSTHLQLARDAVARSLGMRPALAFERFVRGWTLWVFQESKEKAILDFEHALKDESGSAFLARTLYQKYRQVGRAQDALLAVELAHRLDPRDATALFQRAVLRETAGDTAGARHDLRRAFDRRPDRKDVALALVDLEIHDRHPRAALRVIEEYVARVPEARDDVVFRARRQRAEMRLVQSATTVEALEPYLDSPLSDTRRRVGYQLAKIEDDEAETVLRRLLDDPHRAVRVTALRIYMRPWLRARVETDDALFARVVRLLGTDPEALVRGAGAGLLSLVRREEATKVLAETLVGESRDSDPYVRSEAASALDERHHDGGPARQALVQALEDEDPTVRRAAIQALFRLASTYLGYDPEAPPKERAAAIERWKRWLDVPR